MKIDKSNIKKIIKLIPEKRFLFFGLDEKDNLIETSEKFKVSSSLIKFNEKIKKVNEMSLSGLYISVLEDEYSNIIDMDRDIELVIDFPNHSFSKKINVLAVEFIKKDDHLYHFYLSLNANVVKSMVEENIEKIFNYKKIEILKLAELDEL